MLDKMIQWGKKEKEIKALILLGSRARQKAVDQFSDYDISVFCDTSEPFIHSEEWFSQFGNVWICVKEKVFFKGQTFPSRLVIFEGGTKADFSFWHTRVLDAIVQSNTLPDEYNMGYKVLLDKENKTAGMLAPQFEVQATRPTELVFDDVIKEFWFEVYHVGIYLKRNDLWSVKLRSWATQTFLLQMIEWHTQAENSWHCDTPPIGKRMASWIRKDLWHDLHGIFAHFDAEDSWQALFRLMELFRRISGETAQMLGYNNREEVSENMMTFVTNLRNFS